VDVDFAGGWRFSKGQLPGAESESYDDSAWTAVRLPHDWAIAGPFDPKGDPETGKLPWRDQGWYRKRFRLDAADAGKRVFLDFDGVMAKPTVWVNGSKAGGWDYGYCPFRVDITGHVRFDGDNVVAVHVDTRRVETRWYPGAGIYRRVRLVVCDPVHVSWNGLWARTGSLQGDKAALELTACVANRTATGTTVKVVFEITNPSGSKVARCEGGAAVGVGQESDIAAPVELNGVERWDIGAPRLYGARATVFRDGRSCDMVETTFGIREARFDAARGFFLNGRKVPLRGVCLHHDQGPLGAAFLPRAMERQLELLKEMGCNAIRTSHNIPAAEVLDLCDRMGFLVYAEVFDKWDNSIAFPAYAERQIRNFVLRDRNHPSVILWGAGNELRQQRGYDMREVSSKVVGSFKRWDPDRPVTIACSAVKHSESTGLEDPLDVGAYNYHARFIEAHAKRPNRPVLASETASALSTRGHYELSHDTGFPTPSRQITSYDRRKVSWGSLPDREFAEIEACPYVAGEFVWTGFDYLGEPTPYGRPMVESRRLKPEESARSSFFGILDLCGLPKDRYYLYRSHWAPEKPTVHILPHWNWAGHEGKPVPVYVYTSGDSAELFLNGRSLGRKAKKKADMKAVRAQVPASKVGEAQKEAAATAFEDLLDAYRLRWEEVAYEPGELKAVAYRNGVEIGQAVMRTAGPPAKLRLGLDRYDMVGDGDDLIYVTVEALDAQGSVCPNADNLVRYEISGAGRIAGIANGDPHSVEPFVADRQRLFHGKGVVVLQSLAGKTGSLRLTVATDGLPSAVATAKAR
jgi:beta-galactosidase